MRRGTPAAIKLGEWLKNLRLEQSLTLRQVAEVLGTPGATVHQVENGRRALKEDKIPLWAKALNVNEDFLLDRWMLFDAETPGPIVRKKTVSINKVTLRDLVAKLDGNERERVRGYIEAIIENREA